MSSSVSYKSRGVLSHSAGHARGQGNDDQEEGTSGVVRTSVTEIEMLKRRLEEKRTALENATRFDVNRAVVLKKKLWARLRKDETTLRQTLSGRAFADFLTEYLTQLDKDLPIILRRAEADKVLRSARQYLHRADYFLHLGRMADFEREYGNCQSLIGPLLNPKYDNSVEVQEFILQFRALSAKRLEAIQKKIEEMKRKIEKALRTPSLKNTTGFLREELKKHVAQQHKKLLESAAGARYYTATTLYIERLTDRIHHSLLRDRILAMTSKVKTMVRRLQMSIDGKHIDDATHDHKTVKAALLPLIQGEIYHNVPSVLRTFLLVQDIEEQLVRLIPSAKDSLAPIPFNVRLNAMKEEVRRSKGLRAHGLAAAIVTDEGNGGKGNGNSPGVRSRRSSIVHRSPSGEGGSLKNLRRRSSSRKRKSIQRANSSPNQSGSRFPRIQSAGGSPVSPLAATQYNVQPMPEEEAAVAKEQGESHTQSVVHSTQSTPQVNRASSMSGRGQTQSPGKRRPAPVHSPSPLHHSSTSSVPQVASPSAASSPGAIMRTNDHQPSQHEQQQKGKQQSDNTDSSHSHTVLGNTNSTTSSTASRQLRSTWGSSSELEVTTGSIGNQGQETGPTLDDILDLYDKHAQQAVDKRAQDAGEAQYAQNTSTILDSNTSTGGEDGNHRFHVDDNDDDDDDEDAPALTREDDRDQDRTTTTTNTTTTTTIATGSSPQTPATHQGHSASSTPPLVPGPGGRQAAGGSPIGGDEKLSRKEEKRLAKAQRKADRERRRLRRKARKEAEEYTAKGLPVPADIQAILDQPIPQTPDPAGSSPLSVGTPPTPETPATRVRPRGYSSPAVTASPVPVSSPLAGRATAADAVPTPSRPTHHVKAASAEDGTRMHEQHHASAEPKDENYVPPDLGRYSNPEATLVRKGRALQGLSRDTAAVEPQSPHTPQPTRLDPGGEVGIAPSLVTPSQTATSGPASTIDSGAPTLVDHSGMTKAERKAAKAARKADRERRRARKKQQQQQQQEKEHSRGEDREGSSQLLPIPEQTPLAISPTPREGRPMSAQLRTPLSGRPVSRHQSRALENLQVEIEVAKLIESARSQRVRTARSNAPDKG